MKRVVEKDWAAGILGGVFTSAVSALIGADTETTYLIAVGVLAIVIGAILGPERVRLWREEHGTSTPRRH